jgi:membrane protein DedA with SNARE-associated domain
VFETVQEYAEWLQSLSPVWIYAVLALTAYVENLIPPFPGDVSVVVGGYLAGIGLIGLVPAIGFVAGASALGFMTMYAVGRRLGEAVEDPARLRWIPKGSVRTAKRWLQRWGYGVVAANRFLSGVRAVITLLAGAARLGVGPTAFFAALSALVWTTILAYAGYAVGANWAVLLVWLRAYGQVVTVAVLVVVAVVVGRRRWRRQVRREASARLKETAKTPEGEAGHPGAR